MAESLIRTVKKQCLWLYNFESLSAARLDLGRWFQFYNHERSHQVFKMKTPAEAYALAAKVEQKLLGHYSITQLM
ncbi:MAG: integrase core domain-containing protein [Neisseriaceae bacterium]|nr:integrase core domain-containing protein [Neisseriaceae bacterium]